MANKTIVIDGMEVKLRATAAVPRLYRIRFGRDILKDIMLLRKAYIEVLGEQKKPEDITDEEAQRCFEVMELGVFEDVAYTMAKHADPQGVPDDPDEWLSQFESFSIYWVLPEILTLWLQNEQTTAECKKKQRAVAES